MLWYVTSRATSTQHFHGKLFSQEIHVTGFLYRPRESISSSFMHERMLKEKSGFFFCG